MPASAGAASTFGAHLGAIQLALGVGAGRPTPPGARLLAEWPLLVLVGVTGVGKSTTLQRLADTGARLSLLPDRRELTDRLIVAALQAEEGLPPTPVADRMERFAYTRRFRERYPGGMAEALAQLHIDPIALAPLLLFDGLRGANEVTAAASLLPHARFVMLDAPDAVRVVRLLGRGDPFDKVHTQATPFDGATLDAAGLAGEEAQLIFTSAEQRLLLSLVDRGAVTVGELRTRVEIVLEERRNYDPAATREALLRGAGDHCLVIDTTRYSADEAAGQIAVAVGAWWPTLHADA